MTRNDVVALRACATQPQPDGGRADEVYSEPPHCISGLLHIAGSKLNRKRCIDYISGEWGQGDEVSFVERDRTPIAGAIVPRSSVSAEDCSRRPVRPT